MRKIATAILLSLTLVCLMAPLTFAAEAAAGGAASDAQMGYFSWAAMACGLGIGLSALGTGIGQDIGLARARNPGASGKITTTLIIGLAMIESLCIYALVVALIILFAKPFGF